jgi:1-deoxyxylulose-5-phosphate synthase
MPFDYPPEQKQAALELDALAQKWGEKPAHLALAWLLSRPAVGSAIIGPETPEELLENAGVFDVALDEAQLAELDAIGQPPMSLPI